MEKSGIASQLEHIHLKYPGAGHADITKYEFMVNRHRDALNSIVCHKNLLAVVAISENESMARCRFNLIEKMIQPCGIPPKKED